MPDHGFVVAMQGDLLLSTRMRERAQRGIWLIVSRFAAGGGMIALSATGAAGSDAPPAGLIPRATMIGQLMEGPGAHFELLRSPPAGLSVAGGFRPSRGAVWLLGDPPDLHLYAAGELTSGLRWRLGAERRAWIGETVAAEEAGLTIRSRARI